VMVLSVFARFQRCLLDQGLDISERMYRTAYQDQLVILGKMASKAGTKDCTTCLLL
jgi:hypothetical protein